MADTIARLLSEWREGAAKMRALAGKAQRRGDFNEADVRFAAAQDAEAYADQLEPIAIAILDELEALRAAVDGAPVATVLSAHADHVRIDPERGIDLAMIGQRVRLVATGTEPRQQGEGND